MKSGCGFGNACRFSSWRKWLTVVLLGVTSLLGTSMAIAQGRGGISGTVLDTSGAAVEGATVVALDVSKGVKLTTRTTAAGFYSFVSVAPGTYEVTVTHAGFDTDVEKNISVSVDQVKSVNVKLKVGAATETVTVDASSSLLDSTNSTVGQLIGAETIDRVPLLTRDVYELVQLSAGVSPANGTPNASSTNGIFNERSLLDVSSYTINGSLAGSVYYMLDGSPIGVAENNISSILPAFQVPEDGVEEFRVETQNTPATYASGGGGVISLVTKSGTNKFHGDGFGYFRPNALSANDYFYKQDNPGAPPLDFHRYQEGAAIGGPIKKDKLFFFGDYEATQQDQLEVGSFTVPTDAEKTGDFSADSFTVYNPYLPDNPDGTRQPFDGNKIPASLQDPVGLNFTKMFPEPNRAGDGDVFHSNNYKSSGLDPQKAQKFDVRLDYAMNASNRIFGRFSFGRLNFGNADLYGSSNPYDPFYYVNITNTRNVLLADDYTISPTTVLQLRYSFTRHYEDQTGDPRQNGFDITALGFPQALADQVLYKQFPVATLSTTSSVGGTSNEDVFLFASENSDATATLTKVLGKHEVSAGFEYQKKFMNIGQPVAPAGTYAFDNTATSSTLTANDSSDFAALLMGMGSSPGNESGNFTKDIFAAEANPYYAAFVQDNFHVTPKFTLNVGLRWDIFGGRTERHNRLEYFDPNVTTSLDGLTLTGGEKFAGNGGSAFTTNLKDLGPRVAFTWQPEPHFVLRGGAGIYYGPSSTMVANPALNGDGFGSSTNWNATSFNADGNSVMLNPVSNPFPNGVVQPTGTSLGAATNIGAGLATVLHSPRTTTTYNFNLGFEVQLPGESVLSVAYVGSRGLFLPMGTVDLNTLSLQQIQHYGSQLCVQQTSSCTMVPNTLSAIWPATNQWYGADTVPLWLSLEPYPQFNTGGFGSGVGINGYPGADSEYSSLQAKFEKKLSHHVTTLVTFTWGKLMTDDSQPPLGFVGYHAGAPQDWRNLNLEHSVSAQDVKLQFNWNLSYDLPIGKGRLINLNGKLNSALGGWTINGIAYFSDGVPIASPVGTGDIYFNQRVNLNCDPGTHPTHTAAQWFDYSCFSQPSNPLLPGTAPAFLSSVRTDGAHDVDLSIYKSFTLGGDRNLRIEVSSYNISNSVQYGYPSVFWNQGEAQNPLLMLDFGKIYSAANQPRQFQFGARYTF